ncbi:MAG: TetR/AcrR family transcriptional regulator, partial [Stenotrophomonas sp.]|nr:TetR/AcrR family transcriptional regulator [Stenotrophomonas sp.]
MARPRTNIPDRIVRAARHEFLEHGVKATPLRAIARRARTNLGMIYYHFPTKDDLFLAVIEEPYAKIVESVGAILGGSEPIRDRLRALFRRFGAATPEEAETFQLVLTEGFKSAELRSRPGRGRRRPGAADRPARPAARRAARRSDRRQARRAVVRRHRQGRQAPSVTLAPAGPAQLVLLVDQADVVERGLIVGLHRIDRAELADPLAERLGDLLERRQVAAAGQGSGLGGVAGLGRELQCGLARDPAAADDVLDAGREMAELVLLGVEHLERDEDDRARRQYVVGVEHHRRLEVIEHRDQPRAVVAKANGGRAAIEVDEQPVDRVVLGDALGE